MSQAFLKEVEDRTVELPDRPISSHRNFVTEAGLAEIEATLSRFEAAYRAAFDKGARQAAASDAREIRYWRARRASAEVVNSSQQKSEVSFGTTVTLRRSDGHEQSFKIVGEDEANPSHGKLSYVSPVALAVLGHGPGETVKIGNEEALILEVGSVSRTLR
jgi:transcription elongation GreA/GreB family factor